MLGGPLGGLAKQGAGSACVCWCELMCVCWCELMCSAGGRHFSADGLVRSSGDGLSDRGWVGGQTSLPTA